MKIPQAVLAAVVLLLFCANAAHAATLVAPLSTTTALEIETISDVVQADAQIGDIALATSSVSLSYPVRARLFGIIPTTLNARTQVESDGTVRIRYPWYSFFFSTDQAEIETKLAAVGKAIQTLGGSSLTLQQQVTLLTLMHAALQSSLAATGTVQ